MNLFFSAICKGQPQLQQKKYTISNPYADGGSLQLKGQVHCHTTGSDGNDSPTALVTAYKNAGYDFITITDHDVITTSPSVSGITWIGNSVEETESRHIVAYDVTQQSTSSVIQTIINFHKNNNIMTSIAHPTWTGQATFTESETKSYYNFNFIEVFNGLCNAYGNEIWDYALSDGKRTFATAVDDCHNITLTSNFNNGWIVVNTNENTKTAINNSILNGNFYCSSGNDILISLVGNIMTATSTGSSNFIFYGKDGATLKTENGVTSSEYVINGEEMYVRVRSELVSSGKFAWSQPLFIDKI